MNEDLETSPAARSAVVVFTRDLRLRDHPALSAACRAERVVPLFVIDESLLRRTRPAANRLRFLVDSLADLDASLRRLGGALVIRRGEWVDEVARVADQCGADVVHLSDDVSAYAVTRLARLRGVGEQQGFTVVTHPGVTVVPHGELLAGSGSNYQVFTPFYRRWIAASWREPVAVPRSVTFADGLGGEPLPTVSELTHLAPSPRVVRGGETAGLARLRTWTSDALARYPDAHDAIAADATSRCSPYLHFGCVSPLEVATRLRDRAGGEAFVRQLCWRDFFHQLLAARPELAWEDLRDRGTPTGTADEAFAAWRAGRTGYPLVDAGMRQLQTEGFVHNRVRMVVASFLTKDLDIAWQLGARHFMDLLVDGDVASNQLNWQWVAGTGTDANPHRVFNPTRQSQRFDPDGTYIRCYVAELAGVEAARVHDPPDEDRARLGYPRKLVEHADAIAGYRARIA
jgi:deoxyribodipyrimidine photo-lyase